MTFIEMIKQTIETTKDSDRMADELVTNITNFIISEIDYNGLENNDMVMARIIKAINARK